MDLFARCFLLVFAQLYVGGMLAISVPPFHEIERGFYKSSAGIFLGSGILTWLGRLVLLLQPGRDAPAPGLSTWLEMLLMLTSLVAGGIYLWTLWGDDFHMRARSYVASWLFGFAALAVGAQSYRLDSGLGLETILFPILLLFGALVLGAVCTGMLLGHWYLIDTGLAIEPFHRTFRFFAWVLGLQAVAWIVAVGLLLVLGQAQTSTALQQLWEAHSGLVCARLLASPIATACLAWMIWKTLQIPQTMAATGLLYIAILSVLVGEFLGRFIQFRTSLPL